MTVQRLQVERDPDRERAEASEVEVVAHGCVFPDSGDIHIEWVREAFEEGQRAEEPVFSVYRNLADARQATRGTIVLLDEEGADE